MRHSLYLGNQERVDACNVETAMEHKRKEATERGPGGPGMAGRLFSAAPGAALEGLGTIFFFMPKPFIFLVL